MLFNKEHWESWITTCKRKKLDLYLITYTKINSKQTDYLNIKPENIKVLEENIGEKLCNIDFGNDFLAMAAKAQEPKAKRQGLHQSKASLHSKGNKQCSEEAA